MGLIVASYVLLMNAHSLIMNIIININGLNKYEYSMFSP